MAEPIKMPFGLWTRLGPRKHVWMGPRSPGPFKAAIIRGKNMHRHAEWHFAM